MNLSTALAELADEARMYADPDRAIGAARRRRRARFVVTSCAATVAVLLGVVAYLPSQMDRGGGRPAATLGPADRVPPGLRALYPPTVSPRPDAPYLLGGGDPLPGAAFLYAPCPRGDCWPNLVFPDGMQYRVLQQGWRPGSEGARHRDLTLSPDGRYVGRGYQGDGWYYIMDLQSRVMMQIGDPQTGLPTSAWVWSPDSNLLLLAEHRDGQVTRYFLHDMRERAPHRELPASVVGLNGSVVGIRNNGDLLVRADSSPTQLPVLRIVNPLTGQAVKTLKPPAAGGLLAEGERVLGVLMAACDCQVWFTVFAPGETGRPTALLGMDLADGHLTGRIDLPKSADSGGQQPGVWEARASLPGGIALVHHHPGGTDIEILNDVTGERVAVTRIQGDAHVVLRGQARW